MPQLNRSQKKSQRPVALITGGAKRVGKAIALALAKRGYDLAFTYHRSNAQAALLVAELTQMSCSALAIKVDLTTPKAASQLAAKYRRKFDRLDVLVHNASLFEPSDFNSPSPKKLNAMFAIHVTTPMLLTAELAGVLKQAHGHVITLTDLLAEKPMPGYAGYCATKAALQNLTLSMARRLAPEVTVNGIAPGVVEWPDDMSEADREKYLQRVPLKRAGTPDDVAELVCFLASTGSYITGQIIKLDGGRSIFF